MSKDESSLHETIRTLAKELQQANAEIERLKEELKEAHVFISNHYNEMINFADWYHVMRDAGELSKGRFTNDEIINQYNKQK